MTNKKARRNAQRHRPGASGKRSNPAARMAASKSGMTLNTKLTLGLVAFLVLVVGALVVFTDRQETAAAEDRAELLVRPDSHRLSTAGDDKVTLVEFLDFECEACGALYPTMERIREEYDGRITIVARYFPLPGHANGEPAARAVEAAARQGAFEGMYKAMYENQTAWGEQQTSQEEVFIGFAEELGLDMDAFIAAMADPATAERVAADVADGTALGVTGTPTLFLNGERTDARSYEDLKRIIDEALEA